MTAATVPETHHLTIDPFNVLGLVGIMFLVIGGVDLGTQLFPLGLGNPDWEFGTYSSVMDSLPLFTMGLGFLAVVSVVRSYRLLGIVVGVLFILLALLILAGAFLYATNIPQVLRVRPRSVVQTGLKKAIVKGTLQSAIYPIAYLWLGVFVIRHVRRGRRSA
jgi:hypothetical protein